ncbi:MAG: LuxR C-terminal-related transcriptional regulator [Anaerolineae bacterium]|nr:LuxR C-terminal-related transcriptional regulator [Anaerolineae bacterium]
MTTPILATKLYFPPPRTQMVIRDNLVERLNQGLRGKLILISAPAGFGKTTLVSEWVPECGRPTAWLSLDEGDSDLTRFLTYLVAAVQTIAPDIGRELLAALQSSHLPATETIMTVLLNEIATLRDDFLLVLDDYHRASTPLIDDVLTFLLDHLPPLMHLVMTTREDPNLPLARLRARGQLTELRAADLRFTPGESAVFLNQVMGLNLSAEDVTALEARTEGWIAGLQLAALSLQGQRDIPGFIQAFAGDHRYVVDYLVEEVLDRQPEPVRSFLLQTAILDRLNGALCDAVTGQQVGGEQLETLERGNFFIIPLDDQRHWYRYHHLFADVLRMHLMTEQPDQIPVLHRRASRWYEQQGLVSDAIRHALAAEDFAHAADMIELAMPQMRRSRREIIALDWLRSLPDELFHNRPVLSVHYVGVLLMMGELAGVDDRLRDAERWLEPQTDTGEMVVVDEGEFHRLPGSIAVYRAAGALAVGDVRETVNYARQALDLISQEDHLGHGAAAGLLGMAYWTGGNLDAAHQSYVDCVARMQKIGHYPDAIGCSIAQADIQITQGRLRDAMRTYRQALELAEKHGTPILRGAADMYVGMSEIERERNDLDAARQHLLRSKELGELAGLPQNPYRWCAAMARIREIEGDLNGALDLLYEAERLYAGDLSPNVRPIAAFRVRLWLAQGRLGEAAEWVRERGLTIEDDLSYLREFEHITLARLLLTQHKSDPAGHALPDAAGLLERLLDGAAEGGRTGSMIEILILRALAHQMQGNFPAALLALERALTLAEPEGYVRVFVDEGSPVAALLGKAARQGVSPAYVRRLLAAFDRTEARTPLQSVLIEPLSERELEVLRLFGTDLSGPEIARELVVSLNTLRTHTKNIYTKLGVNNRRAAVRRAEEIGLL